MSVYPDPFDPRKAGGNAPEFNPNGDYANGLTGSLSPSSQTNATMQKPSGGGDNPFTAVLDHVTAFNSAMQPRQAPPTQGYPSMPPQQGWPSKPPQQGPGEATPSYGGAPGALPSMPPQMGPMPVTSMPVPPNFGVSAMSGFIPKPTAPENGGGLLDNPSTGGGGGNGDSGWAPPGSTPTTAPPPGFQPPPNPNVDPRYTDAKGIPWSATNLPPKPANSEDPKVAAAWYAQHSFLDPSLVNITEADVNAYRTSGYSAPPDILAKTPMNNNFIAWWQNGKPLPAQTAPPPGTAPPPPGGGSGIPGGLFNSAPDPALAARQAAMNANPNGTFVDPASTISQAPPPLSREQLGQQSAATTPPAATDSTATQAPIPSGAGTPTQPPPSNTQTQTPLPPVSTSTPSEEVQRMMDLYNSQKSSNPKEPGIEQLLNPMFARQRQKLADEIRARGAATGATHAGRFESNVVGDQVSNLAGQQSAALAGQLGEEYIARLNQSTKLTELATNAGMQTFLANMNNDLERYKVNTGADLQKYLAGEDNILKRYGIDQNVFVEKLKAELGLKGQEIGANATITAAQFHAAAAQAAAAASAGASMYASDKNYSLGLAGLGVDREKNIGNFILGLIGLGNASLGNLGDIFGGGLPPGSVIVKP